MKKISCLIISLVFILTVLNTAVSAEVFSDCSPSDWYYESVLFAKEKGWVNGFEDGSFRPNDTLTKAQAVSIVSRAIGLDIPFIEGPWYAGAVLAGKDRGLIVTENFLEDPVERAQVFYMMYVGYNFELIDKPVRDELLPFSDYRYNTYSKVIPTLYSFGLLNGYDEDGKLKIKPFDKLTRAEMCTMLKRISEFKFDVWREERNFYSDEAVKKNLVKMIETNESSFTMYAYGKSDAEVISRLRQVVKLCFEEYEDKYPEYFKNYSTACGSITEYDECIKVTFKMTEK